MNGIYRAASTVEKELEDNGAEITDNTSYTSSDIQLVTSQKTRFQDLFERYCQIREKEPQICFTPNWERQMIEAKNPLVKEAYEKIGAAEVRRMK